jgi:hypothetical protein
MGASKALRALPVAVTVISSAAANATPGRVLTIASARSDGRKDAECRCGIATLHKESKALAAWGSPGWLAYFLSNLFSQDQFSGMGLAQQIALAVMLDNDPPSSPSRVLLSIRRSSEGAGAVCVFAGVAALLSIRDIMFINNNQCNNDNHYQ